MSDGNVQGKHDRPINPDGTANWRVIFEDPERGLLPAIASARSSSQLRQLLEQVALILFKRKRDAEPRKAFLLNMLDILDRAEDSEDGLEQARASIILLLTREKDDRIEKAAAYVKSKDSSRSLERRSGTSLSGGLKWAAIAAVLLALGTAAYFLLSDSVDFAAFFQSDGEVETVVEAPEPAPPVTPASPAPPVTPALPTPPTPAPAETSEPKAVAPEPEKVTMVELTPLSVVIRIDGRKARTALVPLIGYKDGDDEEAICGIAPLVADALTLRLYALSNSGEEADAQRLSALTSDALREVNGKLSRLKLRSLALNEYRKLPQSVVNLAYKGCSLVDVPQ